MEENGFGWRERCRDWGTIAPKKAYQKTDYKTNVGALYHTGFDPDC